MDKENPKPKPDQVNKKPIPTADKDKLADETKAILIEVFKKENQG